jgi:hypothetical protein
MDPAFRTLAIGLVAGVVAAVASPQLVDRDPATLHDVLHHQARWIATPDQSTPCRRCSPCQIKPRHTITRSLVVTSIAATGKFIRSGEHEHEAEAEAEEEEEEDDDDDEFIVVG